MEHQEMVDLLRLADKSSQDGRFADSVANRRAVRAAVRADVRAEGFIGRDAEDQFVARIKVLTAEALGYESQMALL